jgi:hypothetical protein
MKTQDFYEDVGDELAKYRTFMTFGRAVIPNIDNIEPFADDVDLKQHETDQSIRNGTFKPKRKDDE